MKNQYICILFILLLHPLIANNKLFEDLKNETDLKKNQLLVVVYQNPFSCMKCYIEPFQLIQYIKSIKKDLTFKFVALVRCDREIELKNFQHSTGWGYFMHKDDGNARKELLSSATAIISIINSNGKVLLNIDSGDNKKNMEFINSFINSVR